MHTAAQHFQSSKGMRCSGPHPSDADTACSIGSPGWAPCLRFLSQERLSWPYRLASRVHTISSL